MKTENTPRPTAPTFKEAAKFWFKLGLISFGGPAGQIAIMRQELVERRRWLSEARFLHALNYCMLLPGPEAQQLATYIGWLMHRSLGGLIAGGLFVLPGALLMMVLSWAYLNFGNTHLMQAVLWGIKPAVVAIVLFAVYRIASKSLTRFVWWAVAAAAFLIAAFSLLDFPWVVLLAALFGWAISKFRPDWISQVHSGVKPKAHAPAVMDDDTPPPAHAHFRWARTLAIVGIGILLASAMYAALYSLQINKTLTDMAQFFTQAALVTFGGAYAVLPYVTQAAVEKFQWLNTAQMMDGLALGETTPGPLILILTFVGYLGGVKNAVASSPLLSGLLAASVVTFFTFLPSFVMIFAGAPFIESTRRSLKLQAPLTGITAAVVGVIASLGLFFAQHTFWPQGMSGRFDVWSTVLAALALLAFVKFKRGVIEVMTICAVIGLIAAQF